VVVAGIGTGGTITGISRYIKQARGKHILSVGVEPASSAVITQTLRKAPARPGQTKIQGLGAGFIPDTLDLAIVDRVETVEDEEAIETARRLAREEGVLCGISCGAAMAAALRLARDEQFKGQTFVSSCRISPNGISAPRCSTVFRKNSAGRLPVTGFKKRARLGERG